MIAFDTETHLIRPGRLAPPLVCISLYDGTDTDLVVGDEMWDTACWILQQPEIVGHNAAFDIGVFLAHFRAPRYDAKRMQDLIWTAYDENRVKDTMIRDMLAAIALDRFEYDPVINKKNPTFSLAECAKRHLGIELDKGEDTWRLRYAELDGVPLDQWPTEAIEYARRDAEITGKVWAAETKVYGTPADEWLQVRAAWALHLMSAWGLKTDTERVTALRESILKEIADAEEALLAEGIYKDERNESGDLKVDQKKVRAMVEAAMGANTPKTEPSSRFPDGQTQIKAETLEASGHPLLARLAHVMGLRHEMGHFIGKLAPVVNPRFNVLVSTGRTSATNPNIQNQPRRPGVRECFIPRPGYAYVDADWSVAELCALAEVCYEMFGFSRLGEALNEGLDPHILTGSDLMGRVYDEMKALVKSAKGKAEADWTADEKTAMEMRQLAKAENFGFPGGMGAEKFVLYARNYGLTLSVAKVKDDKARFLRRYPEVQELFNFVSQMGTPHTAIQLYSGRRRAGLGYTDGCNTYFQGLVADFAKETMYELARACYWDAPTLTHGEVYSGESGMEVFRGCRPVAFIHDEFLVEAPAVRAEAFKDALVWIMVTVAGRWLKRVKIGADAKVMDRWHK